MAELDEDITDLVQVAFVRGDEAALETAYKTYGSLVYTLCRKTLPEDRAADVTQEVFVSAWRARTRFDPDKGSLAAWLIGIAKNRIVDNVRSEQRHETRRSDTPMSNLPVESDVEGAADRMLVAQALGRLPARQRTAIELAYLGGLTHTEIATKTDIPLGTVKSDIRRGMEQIRSYVGGEP